MDISLPMIPIVLYLHAQFELQICRTPGDITSQKKVLLIIITDALTLQTPIRHLRASAALRER